MTEPKIFWEPNKENFKNIKMVGFAEQVKQHFGFDWQNNCENLWQWSINNRHNFWSLIWDTQDIIGIKGTEIIHTGQHMIEDRFFPEARLNFTENLLRNADDRDAIISLREDGKREKLSRKELQAHVLRMAGFLAFHGVGERDVVAAYMPNTAETVISMLAAASLGATFSSCSSDFGAEAAIDRLSQMNPKVLIASLDYYYAGKLYDRRANIVKICQSLTNMNFLIRVPYNIKDTNDPFPDIEQAQFSWSETQKFSGYADYAKFEFNHPLYILFSSGTTGLPKAIIHGAGGSLLQHMKEHALHLNIQAGDKVFYFTTCGWMMWNWLVSALAQEAAIILYEGNPTYPSESRLWQIAEDERISLMGLSAKYIDSLCNINFDAKDNFDLSNLRTICSTGSPLSEDGYSYIYEFVKSNVHLASISGGTDIISCFAIGSPVSEVRGGVLQMRGLGMSVEVWTDEAKPVTSKEGELVCTKSFPSMPICFGNDPDGEKYRSAYFEHFDGVWRHGDWATLTDDGGLIVHGRSDATLNPGGVRIGTSEIYRICNKFTEINETIAVGLMVNNSQYIVMFVVLNENIASKLTDQLEEKLIAAIRDQASPRHVPSYLMAVSDLPKTRTGKISELVVRDILNGKSVENKNSFSNPEILKYFETITPYIRKSVEKKISKHQAKS